MNCPDRNCPGIDHPGMGCQYRLFVMGCPGVPTVLVCSFLVGTPDMDSAGTGLS